MTYLTNLALALGIGALLLFAVSLVMQAQFAPLGVIL
jgi:hypothetical protein